jgi:hypothetical protein
MSYTKEYLDKAEEMARLPFTVDELAILFEMSAAEVRLAMDDPEDKLGQRIHRGRLLTKSEHYEAVIKLSNNGSGPAQTLLAGYLKRVDE